VIGRETALFWPGLGYVRLREGGAIIISFVIIRFGSVVEGSYREEVEL